MIIKWYRTRPDSHLNLNFGNLDIQPDVVITPQADQDTQEGVAMIIAETVEIVRQKFIHVKQETKRGYAMQNETDAIRRSQVVLSKLGNKSAFPNTQEDLGLGK